MGANPSNSAQTQGATFIIPNSNAARLDTELLEAGPNPAILYSIIDLGTHYNDHFKKSSRLVKLIWEFPLLKQLFKEGDTEVRSTVVSQEYTFMLGESSNLKKLIDGFEGRVLQKSEYANGWNIGQYLDRVCIVNIVNRASKKDPSKIYNNIGTVQGLTDKLRSVYAFDWANVVRSNELVMFSIDPEGKCFQTETFARLPKYFRELIIKSDEGVAFASLGGRFAEWEDYKDESSKRSQSAPPPAKREPVAPKAAEVWPKKIMLVNDFTYEQYIASNWSDELLVAHGKMRIEEKPAETPNAPAPSMPSEAPKAIEPIPDNFLGNEVEDDLDKVDDDNVPF